MRLFWHLIQDVCPWLLLFDDGGKDVEQGFTATGLHSRHQEFNIDVSMKGPMR